MAKTVTEYEPSDIDFDNDPLHKTLFGVLLGAILLATALPKEGDDKMGTMKTAIAFVLTGLERDGYTITKREGDIPKAFFDGLLGGPPA